MTLSLGKFGAKTTLLTSLPFASMEAYVRRTAGRKACVPTIDLVCSGYGVEVFYALPGTSLWPRLQSGCDHAGSFISADQRVGG